ncbi:MAG TPA: long-chain fatty acid--CoA ligase [Kofleriaceae bacterium]|jgi:long-chain acyl-CoA synthetase
MPESVSPERLTRKSTSIAQLLAKRVKETPDREAYRYPVGDSSEWRSMTWKQSYERVKAIAAGLLSLGLKREERVGILCNTRVEWVLADMGILSAGGATTTVYPSSTAEESEYILHDSETRFTFAEDVGQLKKLVAKKTGLAMLEKIILIDGAVPAEQKEWVLTLADLEALGAKHMEKEPKSVDDALAGIKGEHLATLIYTSGTTGKPKGVRLLHECWAYCADAIDSIKLWHADDVQFLWLPLSHSFGKVLVAGHIASGSVTAIDGRVPKVIENLAVVRPTIMAAVPRIFEKAYNKIIERGNAPGYKGMIFKWALGVGKEVSQLRQKGKQPSGLLALKFKLADRAVLSNVKKVFGGRLKFCISGSAPLNRDIAEFFHACDILILEGYGLTESSAASFCNRPTKYAFGTVGFPMPGTECKLAPEDGEILIRSPGIMDGYHNLPDETKEALTADKWLKTGDIGEVDARGFLKITDRKKDLIKTSGGKYIAPQHLEGKVKTACPLVSNVVVHGDQRNFVTALITLDAPETEKWGKEHGISGGYDAIVKSDDVKKYIKSCIDIANKDLARYETIKNFQILPKDLTIEEGELTPSLKVKRKVVEKKYAALLDKMYEGAIAAE